MLSFICRLVLPVLLIQLGGQVLQADSATTKPETVLKVLFIGNSYTARHDLADVVKAMIETGQSGTVVEAKTVIYGGRRLIDHWRLGSQNFVKSSVLTADEVKATIKDLETQFKREPSDKYTKYAIERQRNLLKDLESERTKWDVVVLQSYRDDMEGSESLYAKYAPRFADLAKSVGARVVLYETTPATQNDKPLTKEPDVDVVMSKARAMASLADQIGAQIAPMSLVALKLQSERPDLTLRFINDAHLNQTMAYLTACTLYAAILDANPQGLTVNSITDIRYWQDKDRTKDRDNLPIKKEFSAVDCADLQRIAWEGYLASKQLRRGN